MTAKADIVERLGETAVLLPQRIAAALAANDRIKAGLSLLQDARARAFAPERPPAPEATVAYAGVPANFVSGARLADADHVYAPGLGALLSALSHDLDAMLAPLLLRDAPEAGAFSQRAKALAIPAAPSNQIACGGIASLTRADRDGPDSFHLLVMDLHKAINRLAAETAVETLDGAHVLALNDADRGAVKAFMRGLNRTAPLAFGHPGLDTTAVRSGTRLVIQNDIGTTDAHVLVVHVDTDSISVTYTDVHRPRAKFFMALFAEQELSWTPLSEQPGFSEEVFYLVTGGYRPTDAAARDRFLEFLGSRIVFLIDWNKARKALQTFVGKNAAIALLLWAARHDCGHRAFLDLGGAELVFEAVQRVAAGRIPYGARLDAALGAPECNEFLQHVLRDTSQGLLAGRTARLIRDEIQADLARRFETAESAVLTVLVRHLGLTRSLADAIQRTLEGQALPTRAVREALAHRAKLMEAKADRLTIAAREIAAHLRQADLLRPVIDEIENATDALEDCAFFLSLAPDGPGLDMVPLARLGASVTESVGQMVRAAESASRLPRGQRVDAMASLQAIDAVVVVERTADTLEREAFAAAMDRPQLDSRLLVLALEIARALETASDHLAHAAHALRDRVLDELSA